ncbi:serine/threonine protein phosphatase [Rhizobium sp. K1/93]|nr:serine/threonine protein phosphatase [Rhizobium sp. L58/93]QXZ87408.1 serine/threonine protein phosphatase [Rhizobium sp. K1/93]QXZ93438.1 serine/threonine protein phosphatase [Rhizobium sp. K15/93]
MFLFRRLLERSASKENRRPRMRLDPLRFSAIYAIGDVHGCMGLLRKAYDRILQDDPPSPGKKLVVFLGDYVDRGEDSKAVLEFLTRPCTEGVEHVCLCGNHDAEFFRFLLNPKATMSWLEFGGVETLASYGIDADHILKSGGGLPVLDRVVKQAVPAHHMSLLASLPIMLEVGRLVFVHAGIRPGVPLVEQTDHDLLWIREPFLTSGPKLPVFVFHGHTVQPEPTFGPRRVAIDTGAYATGRLTVLRISEGKIRVLHQSQQ